METKLLRIAKLAKSDPKMKFTSLAHLLNVQSLVQCHHELLIKRQLGLMVQLKNNIVKILKKT
ncbi:hypothetical protein [Metabacillus litoralis]|uniref:hypothetical protein n=1 Tax=Metabacillus litoralis TaxID=152268 RepID=UPI00214B1C04|nr:hypothetical protein [Metabacillus litoralis]